MQTVINYDYSKLRGLIYEKFCTSRRFAQAIGKDSNFVSKRISGKSVFTQADIATWINVLELTEADIPDYFFAKIVDKRQ